MKRLVPFLLAAACAGLGISPASSATSPTATPVTVVIDATAPLNTLTPDLALGAALDGMEKGEVDLHLTPFNIEKMRSSALRRLTYRTRPELGIEVWHWTEAGTWSDSAHAQGYWTGSDNPAARPKVTWGYSLPRRGTTIDNANNAGYSRLDDGDPQSFWKSNPYLDKRYTGAAASRPQWLVVSFDAPTPIQAARILWGAPYARHYQVQYWNGDDEFDDDGRWTNFPNGDVTLAGTPGEDVLRLAEAPIKARFLRVLMLDSSGTAPPGSTDVRDSLGFAVREVQFGVLGADGTLVDAIVHGRTKETQTKMQVSSTDPWHRASDRDLGTEQPGLDFVFASGLTGGLPPLVPVGTFFDTPENAAAEVRFLKARGYPVRQIELGEEPDGQFIDAADYADLYIETAKAVHAVDPALVLGGPSLQSATTEAWPVAANGSWTRDFIKALKARGALGELGFFSFEHYAFDNMCRPADDLLLGETREMDRQMAKSAADGVPRSIPWIISEYGFSPFSGRYMSEMPSALLAADVVGHFLSLGGSAAYMFGYPPDSPANQKFPCAGYGNMMLWQTDDDERSRWPMPVYYAERMMLLDWGAPANRPHRLYGAQASLKDAKGRPLVVAYPLKGPDGRWSVMLINRDVHAAHAVQIVLHGADGDHALGGPLRVVQYGPAQYRWLNRGEASHPVRDLPPKRYAVAAGAAVDLPAFSLTVVR